MDVSVDVIIPAHQAGRHVAAAVRSALQQRALPRRVVVVADACSDDTADKARDAGAEVIELSAHSAAAARNAGLAEATSEWVAFLDADDLWLPSWLEAALTPSLRAPVRFGAVYETLLNGRRLRRATRDIDRGDVFEVLLQDCFVVTSALVVRRSVLERIGGFSAAFQGAGSEDYDCWLRLAEHLPFARVPGRHVIYRRTADSGTRDPQHFARLRNDTLWTLEQAMQRRPVAPEIRRRAMANAYRMSAERLLAHGQADAARAELKEGLGHCKVEPRLWLLWLFARLPKSGREQLIRARQQVRSIV